MKLLTCTVLALAALASAVSAQTKPVGLVEEAKGKITSQRPDRTIRSFDRLYDGQVLKAAPGASAVVFLYSTGARIKMVAGTEVLIKSNRLQARAGPKLQNLKPVDQRFLRVLTPGNALGPKTGGTNTRSGPGAGPRELLPVGAARADLKALSWKGRPAGDKVRVEVLDGEKSVFEMEVPAGTNEVSLPTGLLEPGKDYAWYVAFYEGLEPRELKMQEFRTLTVEEAASLKALQDAAVGQPSRLLATAYETLGLLPEAVAELEALGKLNPADEGLKLQLQAITKRLKSLQG